MSKSLTTYPLCANIYPLTTCKRLTDSPPGNFGPSPAQTQETQRHGYDDPPRVPSPLDRRPGRARHEGITLYRDRDTRAYHALSADGLRLYPVSLQGCACRAGQHGNVCKHQAALRSALGLLGDTDPTPEPPAPAVAASAQMCTSCLDTGWARMYLGSGLNDYTEVLCGCTRPTTAAA